MTSTIPGRCGGDWPVRTCARETLSKTRRQRQPQQRRLGVDIDSDAECLRMIAKRQRLNRMSADETDSENYWQNHSGSLLIIVRRQRCACGGHGTSARRLRTLYLAIRVLKPPGSTQPCIPPGSLNRVPALAGVKAGMSPLSGGR